MSSAWVSLMPTASGLAAAPDRDSTRNCVPCTWMGCAIAMPMGLGSLRSSQMCVAPGATVSSAATSAMSNVRPLDAPLHALAEEIREAVEALALPHPGHALGHITVSVGVAAVAAPEHPQSTLVDAADRALYRAKAAGRNAVAA